MVALSTLFSNESIKQSLKDKPYSVCYGQAFQAKRQEDFLLAKTSCQRSPDHTYDAFAVSPTCRNAHWTVVVVVVV